MPQSSTPATKTRRTRSRILNLHGTSLIEDVRLDDIQEDGIQIRQDADPDANLSTFDTLTIRRLDLEDHQAGFGEAGIEIQTNLASTLAVVIDDSDFAINTNAVIAVAMSKSATFTGHQKVTVQNSRFDASAAFGNGAIQALGSIGSGTTTYLITGNTITNTQFNGITVNNDGGHTNATITNNAIDGSTAVGKVNNGRGISLRQDENGSMTVLISGNVMTQMTSDQIHLQGSDATVDDNVINLDATITNNTGTVAGTFAAGLLVEVGDGSGIAKNDVRINMSGNNLNGTNGSGTPGFPWFDADITLQLNESSGASLRVTQASQAALAAANTTTTVGVFEFPPNAIIYNAGTPPTPTLPLLAAEGGVERAEKLPSVGSPGIDLATPDAGRLASIEPEVSVPERLTQEQLNSVVSAALGRWTATGLTPEQVARLRSLRFEVTALTDLHLGEAAGDFIRVDSKAAGKGWFIDARHGTMPSLRATSAARAATPIQPGAPAGRIDLLTAVMHEMGHALGLDDSYHEHDRNSLMYGFLTMGERRLPTESDALAARERGVAHVHARSHFLSSPIGPFTLPPGKSVTVKFQAQITSSTATQITNQGTVSGTNSAC